MDELIAIILISWLVFTSTCTLQFGVTDYRKFSDITEQCNKQGFIQDKTTRIICKEETK